jgi:hypothetical protein
MTDDVMVQTIALAHRLIVPTFLKAVEHALIAHVTAEYVLPWADTNRLRLRESPLCKSSTAPLC